MKLTEDEARLAASVTLAQGQLLFRQTLPLLLLLLLAGCGAEQPEVTDVQAAVDAGGTVRFAAGTYTFSKTIVVRKSGTIIEGAGPDTLFVFKPTGPIIHCVNDRAFTTPCDVADTPRRQIANAISEGDTSFTALGDASDLAAGDWLIINEKDNTVGEIVVVDWAQVASVAGQQVNVTVPFRTAFPNSRPWEPANGGLAFYKIPQLVNDVQFRNFSLFVPDSGIGMGAISVFGSQNVMVDNVSVQNMNGQALYSYMAKGLTVQNSVGSSGKRTNEFASTVDLRVTNNRLSSDCNAGFGLGFWDSVFPGRQKCRSLQPQCWRLPTLRRAPRSSDG